MRHGVRSLRESWCRAECAPGRTRAAEGNGRRPIVCTRNRTDPISGCAKNGDAPANHILNGGLQNSRVFPDTRFIYTSKNVNSDLITERKVPMIK